MPPRTRRSGNSTPVPQRTDQNMDRNHHMQNRTHTRGARATAAVNAAGSGPENKRHAIRQDDAPAEDSGTQPAVTKKPRLTGPVRARPLRLEVPEEDAEDEETGPKLSNASSNSIAATAVATGPRLQRTMSIYPGRGGPGESWFYPSRDLNGNPAISDDEEFQEDENDWMDNAEVPAKSTRKNPSKFSESIATERPSWVAPEPSTRLDSPQDDVSDISLLEPTSTKSGSSEKICFFFFIGFYCDDGVPSTPVKCESPEELPSSIWPSETDLVYTSGSNKLRLTIQHTYVKAVIHDAVENIKASIMFDDAFPNANVCITFATEALTLAAKGRLPSSRDILARLTDDSQYLAKIIPLVRSRVCLFRSDIKDEFAKIISKLFVDEAPARIAQIVKHQLHAYHYIFPASKSGLASGLVKRSKPYRNDWIISVISTMYFNGGPSSFASRYSDQFPRVDGTYHGRMEMPIVLTSLVATALYVSLYEWHTGEHRAMVFSSNMFLDVYLGHTATIGLIKDRNPAAFHNMMSDIYEQASQGSSLSGRMGAPAAELDIEDLD